MGRWAQKSRRGGSQTFLALTVLDFQAIGSMQADVTFSSLATFQNTGLPSSAIQIGGAYNVQSVTQINGNKLRLTFNGVFSSGVPWQVNTQPPFIKQPVRNPQSGTTS